MVKIFNFIFLSVSRCYSNQKLSEKSVNTEYDKGWEVSAALTVTLVTYIHYFDIGQGSQHTAGGLHATQGQPCCGPPDAPKVS